MILSIPKGVGEILNDTNIEVAWISIGWCVLKLVGKLLTSRAEIAFLIITHLMQSIAIPDPCFTFVCFDQAANIWNLPIQLAQVSGG